MNRDIAALPAKELNTLIAEKVMGWIAWEERRGEYTFIVFQKPGEREPYRKTQNWQEAAKRYRKIGFAEIDNHNHIVTEIEEWSIGTSDTFEVVDTMTDHGWMLYKLSHTLSPSSKVIGYECIFLNIESGASREAKSHSAPKAIAIAALLAMEASHETET